ncbi:MAG: hypothetical protein B6244_00860 [Candidatus Cloacimonetes bacterium 4572_55]|nr:MAG: hypothetical protein B6244_00860 [Candidatus Cloacimonetes bacterium 4572_55]
MALETSQEIRDFIVTNFLFGDSSKKFKDSDSFLDKGIMESTRVLELIEFLEDNYDITVEDDEIIIENLDSVTSIVNYLERK